MDNADNGQLLTIDQVAKVINRSEQTVRRMIKSGKIKAELMESPYGKQYMIPSSEVNASHATMEVVSLNRPIPVPVLVEEIMSRVAKENAVLRQEMAQIRASQERIEQSINERDAKLLQAIRERQEERQEQNKKERPWWKAWK